MCIGYVREKYNNCDFQDVKKFVFGNGKSVKKSVTNFLWVQSLIFTDFDKYNSMKVDALEEATVENANLCPSVANLQKNVEGTVSDAHRGLRVEQLKNLRKGLYITMAVGAVALLISGIAAKFFLLLAVTAGAFIYERMNAVETEIQQQRILKYLNEQPK